jgi:NAD(P)-dependent dehydrogenase (short-subunit alcohol dehydrogenase family)
MMKLFSLEGKTAIVTGAGRGIGRSVALGLAEAGSNVVVCSRTTTELEELAEEIKEKRVGALVIPCDVSNHDDIDNVINQTVERFKTIDILINNAGITKKHLAEEFPAEDWEQILSVNLTGVFLFAQKVGKTMLEQGNGSIVNISSIASQQAVKKSIAYAASKGGVNMLTKNFASEWADRGVRVNGIAPAYIETPLVLAVKNHRKGFVEDIVNRTPMKRMGKPEEIVGAAIFLASEASSYITGETIFVDGGWTAIGL